MPLTKAEIQAAEDRRALSVPTPEWGEGAEVLVRGLSGTDYATLGELGTRAERFRFVIARGLVDEAGEPLDFNDLEVRLLGDKHRAPLERIYDQVCRLSGIGEPEDAAKN